MISRRALLAGTASTLLAARAPELPWPAGPDPASDLHLTGPIDRWDEALPLGNGLLGCLVWGSGNRIRLSLDIAGLWDLRMPPETEDPDFNWPAMQEFVATKNVGRIEQLFDTPYSKYAFPTKIPAGRLEMTLGDDASASLFSLPMAKPVAHVNCGVQSVDCMVLPNRPVAVVRIAGALRTLDLVVPPALKQLDYEPATHGADSDSVWFTQRSSATLSWCILAKRTTWERGAAGMAIAAVTAAGADLALAGARRLADDAAHASFVSLTAEHNRWWKQFWAGSSVRTPEPAIQRQYDFVKYLYGAGARSEQAPLPLQGVWTADDGGLPPWKGDYHNDLNTQMTYLAWHVARVNDSGSGWLEFNQRLLPEYRRFAKEFYRAPGAVIPGVMTLDGKPLGGWPQYSYSPTMGAWIAQSFIRDWRIRRDAKALRETHYPFCREIGDALLHLLRPAGDGTLRLPLSSSPEIYDNSLKAWLPPNSNFDTALIANLFVALAEMAAALKIPGEAERWRHSARSLPPLSVDPATGALALARNVPFFESHRHFSHAMAIHPLGLVSVEGSEAERGMIAATLKQLEALGTSAWCGYSFSWFACMLARCAEGETAVRYLRDYVKAFILRNGFHANGDQTHSGLSGFTYSPVTLEGNFLAMEAVHEMLFQSWGGVMRIFPAVPAAWANAGFAGLAAENGCVVSAHRQAGRTVRVHVAATVSGAYRMRDPFGGATPTWSGVQPARDGQEFRFTLKKGGSIDGRLAT
ncbi:MAG: glycoside hydrolase N-terminal domain-containing protein [Armatimonadetes bacterium]|nr:glycoside hydrolase N-terminal domain-containing protein [Armatimonadota bacterium]MDE2206072.1 glycoside hydrolase N-terminal domain-containing protein [Armatimonadota bacterium]